MRRRPGASPSGGTHRGEELALLVLDAFALVGELLRRGEHLRGGEAGLGRAAIDLADVGATCVVPEAACCTLRVISCVAAPCSSIAAAIVVAISEMRPMVPPISLMATTDSWVADCIAVIWLLISLVALAVWAASCFTSWATPATPLPASPARAALSATRTAVTLRRATDRRHDPSAGAAPRPPVHAAPRIAALRARLRAAAALSGLPRGRRPHRRPVRRLLVEAVVHRAALLRAAGHAVRLRSRSRRSVDRGGDQSAGVRAGARGGALRRHRERAGAFTQIRRPPRSRPDHGALDGAGR